MKRKIILFILSLVVILICVNLLLLFIECVIFHFRHWQRRILHSFHEDKAGMAFHHILQLGFTLWIDFW
jgi:hypothetical protein